MSAGLSADPIRSVEADRAAPRRDQVDLVDLVSTTASTTFASTAGQQLDGDSDAARADWRCALSAMATRNAAALAASSASIACLAPGRTKVYRAGA
jgi:hypothetical protein